MPSQNYSRITSMTVMALAMLAAVAPASAQQETILYNFGSYRGDGNCTKGGPLVFGTQGNLYGTTTGGGPGDVWCDGGTAFELTPTAGGGWTENVIGYFNTAKEFDGPDAGPLAGPIFDSAGNLYGTVFGYAYALEQFEYFGGVFELTPTSGGGWQQETLMNGSVHNGQSLANAMLLDTAGNLYGTAGDGGIEEGGVVFELSPAADGTWTEKTLYSFVNGAFSPHAPSGLVLDAAGNLFGVTSAGGANEAGVVYELSPQPSGEWSYQLLHTFGGPGDGGWPTQPLIFDAAGNLYGTTTSGGCVCYYLESGTAFELSPASDGTWTEKILHRFGAKVGDGIYPTAGVVLDTAGNLYGTTYWGGSQGQGIAYELSPTSSGEWTEKALHIFGFGSDGASPASGLVLDQSGNLYGTTVRGGAYGDGTVFEITP
jgi:uncharacterized repeat protein (TIGR03803 family)